MFRKLNRNEGKFSAYLKEICRSYSNHSQKCCIHIKVLDEKYKIPVVSQRICRQYFFNFLRLTELQKMCSIGNSLNRFHTKATEMILIRPISIGNIIPSPKLLYSKSGEPLKQKNSNKLNEKFDAVMFKANIKTQSLQNDLKIIQQLSLKMINDSKKNYLPNDDSVLKVHLTEMFRNQKRMINHVNTVLDHFDQNMKSFSEIEFKMCKMESKLIKVISTERLRSEVFLSKLEENQKMFIEQMDKLQQRNTNTNKKPAYITIIILVITLGLNNKEILEYSKKLYCSK